MHHSSKTCFHLTIGSLFIALGLAIAPARAQNLFVANQGDNTIRAFSPGGADLGDFATTGLNTPRGLAFDKSGNLYAGNLGDNTIRKFSPTGVDLGFFTTTGVAGVALIAFDKSDNLYVTNMLIDAIEKFSPTGADL